LSSEAGSDERLNGKVLFVDDELNVLRSIKRGFLHSSFQVLTAPGAREGLRILEKEDVDIVVTDYRMPYMDGLKFLQEVRERHPGTARVILSGYIEKTVAVESLTRGLASTYILKPWLNDDIEKKIEHILTTRRVLQSNKLLDIINGITNLPILSPIFHEFMEAVHDERSMADIALIIQKEPSVATKVLQIANSAFYGMNNCTSINQAAVTLGLDTLHDILLTISIISPMKWGREQLKPLQDILIHSFIMNQYLPVLYNLKPGVISYRNFPSVGLTFDVGKIILLQYFPDRFEAVMRAMMECAGMNFYEAELLLRFKESSHQVIGAYFLDYWNLPEVFVETALFHHCPDKSSDHYRIIVEMANYIETLIESVYNMGEVLSEAILELREDFIPEKIYLRMIESIGKMITDGPFLLVSYS
jgi:HD-like signal output (HDOD) protein